MCFHEVVDYWILINLWIILDVNSKSIYHNELLNLLSRVPKHKCIKFENSFNNSIIHISTFYNVSTPYYIKCTSCVLKSHTPDFKAQK